MLTLSPRPLRAILGAMAAILGTALCPSLGAGQSGDVPMAGTPYFSTGAASTRLGTTPLRIWHSTRGYAQEESETAFGGRWAMDMSTGIFFVDGQFRMSNTSDFGLNIGGGFRWRHSSLLTGDPRIFGVSGWYDAQETNLGNYLNQGGVSFESLGELVDFRLNANLPGDDVALGDITTTGDLAFVGNNLSQTTLTRADVPLSNINFEMAVRVPDTNIWGYGGGYQLDGQAVSTTGYKLGVRGYAYDDLLLDLGVSDDDDFGTLTTFQVIWTPGRTSSGMSTTIHRIGDRMREPVFRPNYIATRQTSIATGVNNVNNPDGTALTIVHVDSTATAPGNGTAESPLTSLNDVLTISDEGDIVLVHSGSTYAGQGVQIQAGQRLLGEGGDVSHTVATQNFGTLTLPETSPGSLSGAIPIISNAPVAAVQAGANVLDPTAGPLEVRNFAITGGNIGILSSAAGSGSLNVTDVTIANTGSHGVQLASTNWTHTLTNVGITDAGNAAGEAAVKVSGGDADLTFAGRIVQGAVASGAASVDVDGGHTGTLTFSEQTAGTGLIDAQNGTGLQFSNADGVYTFNHAVALRGGDAGIDMINGTDGSFTLVNAEITDPTGTAINIDGGDAALSYTGKVTQNNDATAMAVSGNHNGTVIFNEATAGEGVFEVTNGDGLQFAQADGAYTFNHAVTLDGGDAGIDLLSSDGTFVFADATITDPTGLTGEAVVVDGGAAIMTFNGRITQQNNHATVVVRGGHTGSLVFNEGEAGTGVIAATNGTGLQFNDADGAYAFNHEVVLNGSGNGADTALDIFNDSDGTITFADASITNPTGIAVDVDGGDADLNFVGLITQANNAATLEVTGGHTGNLTFSEAVAGSGSVNATNGSGLQFSNADGTYVFNHEVLLNGSANGAATAIDIFNDSDGTISLADAEITNPAGIAVDVDGGNANLGFTGLITQTNNFAAVEVTGGHTGSLNFNEATLNSGVVDASNGTGLRFDNADGTYAFNAGVDLAGADAGIDIGNGSSGNFSFDADSEIVNPTGTGLLVDSSAANVFYNGTISKNNAGRAVVITSNTGGSVTVSGAVTDTSEGIQIANNTGGTTRFSGAVNLSTAANDALQITSNSGGNTRFDNLDITTTTGDGLVVSNTNTVEVTGSGNTITSGTGTALSITNSQVGALGVNFQSVSADGSVNAIVVTDVTGGPINLGSGANFGDGGTLQNTTGDAVVVSNVANLSLNSLRIDTSGGDGVSIAHTSATSFNTTVANTRITGTAGAGIDLNSSGSAQMRVTFNDNNINNTALAGMDLSFNGDATSNVTVTDNLVTNSSGNEAFLAIASGGSAKTVNMLLEDNTFNNNDAAAFAADIRGEGAVNLNATVLSNNFSNANAVTGVPVRVQANDVAANLRLNLNGNTASPANPANDGYELQQVAGSFAVEDLPDVGTRNTGTVNQTGVIANDPGPIPTP